MLVTARYGSGYSTIVDYLLNNKLIENKNCKLYRIGRDKNNNETVRIAIAIPNGVCDWSASIVVSKDSIEFKYSPYVPFDWKIKIKHYEGFRTYSNVGVIIDDNNDILIKASDIIAKAIPNILNLI